MNALQLCPWQFSHSSYGWGATSENRSTIGDFAPTRSLWSKISGTRDRPPPQGVYKSSLTNFEISRTHLTNFQYIFYIDRASLVLQLYVQWNGKLHYINAHTSMNSEMFSYEHVMMSSSQRSSLCHPSYFTNKNDEQHSAMNTEKSKLC